METSEAKKTTKSPSKKGAASVIRVLPETRKRLLAELAKINKKEHGKSVKPDALIARLLGKLTAQDVSELQEASLSGKDRLEQNFRAYCAKFGSITMDQFLDLISRETVPQILNGDAANPALEKGELSVRKSGA